jgi:hypothetical protein
MDDDAEIHQPMSDDGVCHESDEEESEVRAEPTVG